MRSISSLNLRDFFPPSANEALQCIRLGLLQAGVEKGCRQEASLKNSDVVWNHLNVLLLQDRAGVLVIQGFKYSNQLFPMMCFFINSQSASLQTLSSVFNQWSVFNQRCISVNLVLLYTCSTVIRPRCETSSSSLLRGLFHTVYVIPVHESVHPVSDRVASIGKISVIWLPSGWHVCT